MSISILQRSSRVLMWIYGCNICVIKLRTGDFLEKPDTLLHMKAKK